MERKVNKLVIMLVKKYIVINKEINSQISSMNFKNKKVFITNVDSQQSSNGGILVQVLGEMSNQEPNCQKFCQTFFLAQQPSGYYILNDIFRFLKEEIDIEDEEVGDSFTFVEKNQVSVNSSRIPEQQQKPISNNQNG